MRGKLATTLKVTFAFALSVLVSTSPLTPAYAYATTDSEVQQAETTTQESTELQQVQQQPTEPVVEEVVVNSQESQRKAPQTPPCVDAKNPSNLTYTWSGNDTVIVGLKGNREACDTTTVYLSSYTMPHTWDGKGFNQTAAPQTVFDSTSVTFEGRGTVLYREAEAKTKPTTHTLTVKLPNKCKNVQVDLYYAPEIKNVTWPTGHGHQYISHKFIKKQKCEVKPCPAVIGYTTITKDSQFADYNGRGIVNGQDTRSAGHYEFTDNGLRIYTDNNTSQAKVAWYHGVSFPLADAGEPTMSYTGTTPAPGLQMVVDFDGNGTPDGILVGETVYGNDWWTPGSSEQFVKDGAPVNGGGSGSQWHGTLSQWLSSFPDAQVVAVGFSLGSGIKGDGVIKSLTFGCHKWKFEKPAVDVCPNLPGDQATVPEGYVVTDEGQCVVPGLGGGNPTPEVPTTTTPEVLGASTTTELPATLPATGNERGINPLLIIMASLLAYGVAYFVQGRRILSRTQA